MTSSGNTADPVRRLDLPVVSSGSESRSRRAVRHRRAGNLCDGSGGWVVRAEEDGVQLRGGAAGAKVRRSPSERRIRQDVRFSSSRFLLLFSLRSPPFYLLRDLSLFALYLEF